MIMWNKTKIRRENEKRKKQDYKNRFNLLAKIQDQRKKKEAIEKSKMGVDTIGKTPTENLTVGK